MSRTSIEMTELNQRLLEDEDVLPTGRFFAALPGFTQKAEHPVFKYTVRLAGELKPWGLPQEYTITHGIDNYTGNPPHSIVEAQNPLLGQLWNIIEIGPAEVAFFLGVISPTKCVFDPQLGRFRIINMDLRPDCGVRMPAFHLDFKTEQPNFDNRDPQTLPIRRISDLIANQENKTARGLQSVEEGLQALKAMRRALVEAATIEK